MDDSSDQSIKFYDKEALTYDERRWSSPAGRYIDQAQKAIFLELVGRCDGLKVLDIATGTGRFALELAKKGAVVTVLDSSENMLNIVQDKFKKEGLENQLTVHTGVATDLPFKDEEFDISTCINAMNHIPGFEQVLSEMSRVTRSNGITVTNYTNWLSIYFPFGVWANLRKKSVTRNVYTKWFHYAEIKSCHNKNRLDIERSLGAVQFPGKTTNKILLAIFTTLDKWLRKGSLHFLSPMLFIKARKK